GESINACSTRFLPAARRFRGFVILGIENYVTAAALAFALGGERFVIAKSQMDEPAFARAHRGESIGRAGTSYALRRHFRCQLELVLPGSAVALAVEGNFVVVFRMNAQSLMGDGFERTQQLAAALEQQAAVSTGQLDQDFRGSQIVA